MKVYEIDGKRYRLSNTLTDFQLKMYVHLVNWKWSHLTLEPGYHNCVLYDTILPESFDPLYPPIKARFLDHQRQFHFKSHEFLGHMASSQAACVNLFLPLLQDPQIAAQVLRSVKPDLKAIATGHLDNGSRIEFWDEPENALHDHNLTAGTDADMAIAYYDFQGDLNLWLIEHKLTEPEFTTCGGFKSKGRTPAHACAPAAAILDNPRLCYYHSARRYRYWDITLGDASPMDIDRIRQYPECPFKGGMNQLWRNQLLAASIESSTSPRWGYKKVYFSVVHHPGNRSLLPSITRYQELLRSKDRFFVFTSDQLIQRAREIHEPALIDWLDWYQGLYAL
jgi:hypothetical protein